MSRLTITISPEAKSALLTLAEMDARDPRSLGGLIIEQELSRRGLLGAALSKKLVETALCLFGGRPVNEFLDVVEEAIDGIMKNEKPSDT